MSCFRNVKLGPCLFIDPQPGIIALNSICTSTFSENIKFTDNEPHTCRFRFKVFGVYILFSFAWFNEKLFILSMY